MCPHSCRLGNDPRRRLPLDLLHQMDLHVEAHQLNAFRGRAQADLAEKRNTERAGPPMTRAHDSEHDGEIGWVRLGPAIRQKLLKPGFSELALSLLHGGSKVPAELLIAHKGFGGDDALIPKMADRGRPMAILQVDELPLGREKITWFKVRTSHAGGVQLNLIEIQKISMRVEFLDEFAFVHFRG